MMDINLDEKTGVVHIQPHAALTEADFSQLTTLIDAYIQQQGLLKGVIIETKEFPGWEDIKAFIAHVKFIKSHHKKVQKIALVTNSKLADIARTCIAPFIVPEIKHFPYGQVELANLWIEQP